MGRQLPALLPPSEDGADRINLTVCRRMKARRILENMSQERLAKGLGISYQQLQRYESGKSRLPSSMLYQASLLLGVPVTYFFETMASAECGRPDRDLDKASLLAVRNIQAIPDTGMRQALLRLIDQLACASRITQ